jgi:hypothetical protein
MFKLPGMNMPGSTPVEHQSRGSGPSHDAGATKTPERPRSSGNPFAAARQMGARLQSNLRKHFGSTQPNSGPRLSAEDRIKAEGVAAYGRATETLFNTSVAGLGTSLADRGKADAALQQVKQQDISGLKQSAVGNGDLRRTFVNLEALGGSLDKIGKAAGGLNPHQQAVVDDVHKLLDKPIGKAGDENVTFRHFGAPGMFDRMQFDNQLKQNFESALNDLAQLHKNALNPEYVGQPAGDAGAPQRQEIPASLRPGHSPQGSATGLQRRQHVKTHRPEPQRQEGPARTGGNGLDPQLEALKGQAEALGNYKNAFKTVSRPPSEAALKSQAEQLKSYAGVFKPASKPPAA